MTQTTNDILSIEGLLVIGSHPARGRVEINTATGTIVHVGPETGDADKVFDQELIFPGFIDLHVHAREDASRTQEYKEDFLSASDAAINGGVVAFADMPNNPVPPVDEATYAEKSALTKKSPLTILLYAGIGKDTSPLSEKVPYKVFMGKSIGDMFFTTREDLEETLTRYAGCSVSFHCEDPKIMDEHKDAPTHEQRRPAHAEVSAVDTALYLIEKYHLHGKICHTSTTEGVQKIQLAKVRGVDVSIEVTPHHLYFDETMLTEESRTGFQVNPPIRQTRENRLALIQALKDGVIDYLATDHAPHTQEEKVAGMSGLTHLDTYGAFCTWLIQEHGVPPTTVARVASENPGIFLNTFSKERYGKIEPGYIGSLAVVDTHKPTLVDPTKLKTKCGWSPFLGVTFPGDVVLTIIKGKIYEKK